MTPRSVVPEPSEIVVRPLGTPTPWTYGAAQRIFGTALRVWNRLEAEGLERFPGDGPCLILPNHASHLDPPIMGAVVRREMHTLARHDLYKVPGLRWFMRAHNVHPIKRGAVNRDTIRLCTRILKTGWPLMIFAEGTRTEDGFLQRPKGGFGMIVDEVPGIPCVPVAILGSERALGRGALLPRPTKIRVRVGDPFLIEPRGEKESRRDFYERCADALFDRWMGLGVPVADTGAGDRANGRETASEAAEAR